MIYYAGIGSRETPSDILCYFEKVSAFLARKDFVLRSGHAKGADQAFENGCDKAKGKKEIFLPWKSFEGSISDLIVKDIKAFEIGEKFHPNWNRLPDGARKLQARNSHQVLGWDLNTPSSFIICWTEGGWGQGGTGQALRIASHYNIPIFDAGSYSDVDSIKLYLKSFLVDNTDLSENDFIKKE
jgi:hypothetical protein